VRHRYGGFLGGVTCGFALGALALHFSAAGKAEARRALDSLLAGYRPAPTAAHNTPMSMPTPMPSQQNTRRYITNPTRASAYGPGAHHARAVAVTGVAVDNSTAKIDYRPVAGAKDYRVLDVSNPVLVKYAGLMRYLSDPYGNKRFAKGPDGVMPVWPLQAGNVSCCVGPEQLNIPANEIEWNNLEDGRPHTLVVQAVDALGPVPGDNLYRADNTPVSANGMAGSDMGLTTDGLVSINGQGPHTDAPRVIAQSAPFVVQANSAVAPVPSRPDAQQTFLDTFDDGEAASFKRAGPVDPRAGSMTYTLNAGSRKAWHIQYLNADITHSAPFIMEGHFMDNLFDGSTPGVNDPLHVAHGVMAMSPDQTADFSGGKMLHATMEVDAHVDPRRWIAFNLAPAGDPLVDWYGNGAINKSDHAFFAEVEPGTIKTTLFDGPNSPSDPSPHRQSLTGAAGQAAQEICRCYAPGNPWHSNGHGLDNRSRLDLFVTTTHFAYFEDGGLVAQGDIPGGLGFDAAKVYFAHYLYHSDLDHQELQSSPWETYWLNQMPYSDERHWDNMGFEVLPPAAVPSGSDWSALASLITMPQSAAPTFSSSGVTTTIAPTATATPPSIPATGTATASSAPATSTASAMATATSQPATATSQPAKAPAVNGLPSGRYTVETRIIDAQGQVKVITTAPLVIP